MGSNFWRTAWAKSVQGAALSQLEEYDYAEELLLQSYELLRTESGPRPFHIDSTREALNAMYISWGRPDDAVRYTASGNR